MTTEKSKIQLGIDHIFKHPGCRMDDLAPVLGIERKSVIPCLYEAIKCGLILSCKVERPGTVPVNEFRLSASAPDGKAPDWKTWKKANPPQDIARRGKESQTQAHRGANNGSSGGSERSRAHLPGAVTAVEPPTPAPQQAEARSGVISLPSDVEMNIRIDNDGRLHIAQGDFAIELHFKHTRELGKFMTATAGVWN